MRSKFDLSVLPAAPDFQIERSWWQRGWQRIGGIDEAGRGAFAGPVAAAVVIFPREPALAQRLAGVNDSKQVAPAERLRLAVRIRYLALAWAVGFASCEEIDASGILPATRLAVQRALDALEIPPDFLILDYLELPQVCLPQFALIKGDARSLSIAAASILAKTARDAHLEELDAVYPGYGFANNKGYGTASHRAALQRLGPSPEHRSSFRIMKTIMEHE